MTGIQVQQATHGRWLGEIPDCIRHVCTDSRRIQAGDTFLALRGPQYNGHDFGRIAASRGASSLIGDYAEGNSWQDIPLPRLQVEDGLTAFGGIAAAWRRSINSKVVAITGSVGKTSLRNMLEHALRKLDLRIAATHANENNLIGVPANLLQVTGNEDIALIECGISEPGEMTRLADIIQPDVAVITAVTDAHTEGLGSITGVLHEKTRLLNTIQPGGWCAMGTGVYNMARKYAFLPDCPILDMDSPHADSIRWSLTGTLLHLQMTTQHAEVELALPASHWAANMALAISIVCRLTGSTLSEATGAMAGWQTVSGRMQLLSGPGGYRVIDDTYNANPASMQAALDTLNRLPGRHFAVLGNMAELGADTEQLHAALEPGELTGLILVGNHMHLLRDKYPTAICVADTAAAIESALAWQLTSSDHVLVKASRIMGLDTVVQALTEATHAV